MFIIARNYLVDLLKNKVGIPEVGTMAQVQQGGRSAVVFSKPFGNRLAFTLNYQQGRARKWADWSKLNQWAQPTLMERLVAAEQSIVFRVVMTNTTAEGINDDFQSFVRNISSTIYDGATAKYQEVTPAGTTNETDTKGNKIEVSLSTYDFNDNKYYGAETSKVIIDVEFTGHIYQLDRECAAKRIPGSAIGPDIANSTLQTTP